MKTPIFFSILHPSPLYSQPPLLLAPPTFSTRKPVHGCCPPSHRSARDPRPRHRYFASRTRPSKKNTTFYIPLSPPSPASLFSAFALLAASTCRLVDIPHVPPRVSFVRIMLAMHYYTTPDYIRALLCCIWVCAVVWDVDSSQPCNPLTTYLQVPTQCYRKPAL